MRALEPKRGRMLPLTIILSQNMWLLRHYSKGGMNVQCRKEVKTLAVLGKLKCSNFKLKS